MRSTHLLSAFKALHSFSRCLRYQWRAFLLVVDPSKTVCALCAPTPCTQSAACANSSTVHCWHATCQQCPKLHLPRSTSPALALCLNHSACTVFAAHHLSTPCDRLDAAAATASPYISMYVIAHRFKCGGQCKVAITHCVCSLAIPAPTQADRRVAAHVARAACAAGGPRRRPQRGLLDLRPAARGACWCLLLADGGGWAGARPGATGGCSERSTAAAANPILPGVRPAPSSVPIPLAAPSIRNHGPRSAARRRAHSQQQQGFRLTGRGCPRGDHAEAGKRDGWIADCVARQVARPRGPGILGATSI